MAQALLERGEVGVVDRRQAERHKLGQKQAAADGEAEGLAAGAVSQSDGAAPSRAAMVIMMGRKRIRQAQRLPGAKIRFSRRGENDERSKTKSPERTVSLEGSFLFRWGGEITRAAGGLSPARC